MKKILLFLYLMGFGLTGFAQSVQYTLRYNIPQARYEVYVKPDFSQNQYNWGSSQVSVVVPSSLTNTAFAITSVAVGGWVDNSQAYDVVGADFHGIGTNGTKVDLMANTETLLFYFVLPGGQCISGLRLYVNGTDPNSGTLGMNGGDFANTLYSGNDSLGSNNLYVSNYANTGTACTVCNLIAPILSK